jgi:phosphohistidine phosphatase
MTTRTLVILRHAKAEQGETTPDIDRSLTKRGHADAAAAGVWLAGRGIAPDLVLCSPSRRTRETWHEVSLALTAAPAVRYEETIYAASTQDLLDLVTGVTDADKVLLIGHNPGLSHLSALLDPAHAEPDGLRTSGAAVHSVAGEWVECGHGTAPLIALHTARG